MKTKPDVYIDTQLATDEDTDHAYKDTNYYSITPTSFRARNYFSNIDGLQNQGVEDDEKEESTIANCKWYTDEYSKTYNQLHVLVSTI